MCMSWSSQGAMTKYNKLFLIDQEAGKFKIMMLTDSVSGETPHPGSQMTIFLLGQGVSLLFLL